mgnify:CR=1 FL=1
MINCKECEGMGSVPGLTMKLGPSGPYEVYRDVECEVCEGSGELNDDDKQEEKNK